MKSISEIAKKLDITYQAVYKKINNQLKTELKKHIHLQENKKILIDDEGIEIIEDSLKTDNFRVNNQLNTEFITFLQRQIEIKDSQIDNLLGKIENMQVLLKNEQDKNKLLLTPKEKKAWQFWRK